VSPHADGYRPPAPRIPMPPIDELDERGQQLLRPFVSDASPLPNALLALVHHAALFEAWLPLATQLLNGSAFSPRHRELVIMRTAVVIGSDYEWAQHVVISDPFLDDDDRARVVLGPGAPGWTPVEAALLTAVDELHEHAGISDTTWGRLAGELDERKLIELPVLVGHYHLMAFALHALGVQPEDPSLPVPPVH
jgi:alkylhydroperoxidase family enzyme